MHILRTLTLAPLIQNVHQLWGHINIIVSAPFVTVSVVCCICIVYCKAYCGNELLFFSVYITTEVFRSKHVRTYSVVATLPEMHWLVHMICMGHVASQPTQQINPCCVEFIVGKYSQGRNGKKTVESCTLWYYFEIWHGVRVCDGDKKKHWLQVGKSLWWPVAAKFKMAATDIIIFHISGLNNHTLKCNTSFYRFSGLVSPFLMSI